MGAGLPGVGEVDGQQLAAGDPQRRVALSVVDDLQQELPVVVVDLLRPQ